MLTSGELGEGFWESGEARWGGAQVLRFPAISDLTAQDANAEAAIGVRLALQIPAHGEPDDGVSAERPCTCEWPGRRVACAAARASRLAGAARTRCQGAKARFRVTALRARKDLSP